MNPLKNIQLKYWLVNLGNMYYAGGLLRKTDDDSTFSYEFVNDETYGCPILEEHGAIWIAKKCGGIVVERVATSEELTILEDKNERFINSESKARLKQELNARKEMKKAEDIQTLEYELEQLNYYRN
ncbi:hypothetical protein ACWKS7_27135 [Bacillus cereus]